MSSSNSENMDLNIDFSGKLINKEHVVLKKIGSGAFASVWLCYNIIKNIFYAVKIQNVTDEDEIKNELEISKKFKKCEYINKILLNFNYKNNETSTEYMCFIYELCAGSSYDVVGRGKYAHGLPYEIVISILYQTLLGLSELHKNDYVHTDIKPENILVHGKSGYIENFINKLNISSLNNKIVAYKCRNKCSNVRAVEQVTRELLNSIESDNDESAKSDITDSEKSYEFSLIEFSESDDKYDPNMEYLSDTYLNPIKISISDFGLCRKMSDINDHDIQTRYYRAPEILLKTDFNEKIDIWSLGCMAYELLTGKILFDSHCTKNSTDRAHLFDIQCKLGPIDFSDNSKFYNSDGLIKGYNQLKYESLISELLEKTNCPELVNVIMKMLTLNYKNRPSANDCIMIFKKDLNKWINCN